MMGKISISILEMRPHVLWDRFFGDRCSTVAVLISSVAVTGTKNIELTSESLLLYILAPSLNSKACPSSGLTNKQEWSPMATALLSQQRAELLIHSSRPSTNSYLSSLIAQKVRRLSYR